MHSWGRPSGRPFFVVPAAVIKGADGTVHILEMQGLSLELAAAIATVTAKISGLLSEADLTNVAGDLGPGRAEAVFLVEHLWVTEFASAVRAAGGTLLMSERIPGAVIEAARATLIAAADAV